MAGNSGNESNLSLATLNLHEATEAESRASCQLLAHRLHHKAVRLDGWMRMGDWLGSLPQPERGHTPHLQVRDAGCAVQRHGAPCHPAAPLRVHAFRDREKRWDRGGDFGGADGALLRESGRGLGDTSRNGNLCTLTTIFDRWGFMRWPATCRNRDFT
jgi:hypothetical protein